MRVGIVDYGFGNIASVQGAVAKIGHEPVLIDRADGIQNVDKLILPGVGAFGDAMASLNNKGLVEPLRAATLEERIPILGICLGFQLLARSSSEHGEHHGLGWIDADVRRLEPGAEKLRVPHVGWNEVYTSGDCVLFQGVPDAALFYFVHSYRLVANDNSVVIGTCPYGGDVTAAVQRDNIYGTQFHPEKSQQYGLTVLTNFVEAG